MDEFNFAILKHNSGLLMISVDSLIGYFKRLDDRGVDYSSKEIVSMFEDMLRRTGYEKVE